MSSVVASANTVVVVGAGIAGLSAARAILDGDTRGRIRQRQTKSLKETSVSMILRSLRCWWWFTRKPVMVLCLYNSFQHSHSKRVPNYVTTTNNGQNWTIFECGPFHDH